MAKKLVTKDPELWLQKNEKNFIFCKRNHCTITKKECKRRQKKATTDHGFTTGKSFFYENCIECPQGDKTIIPPKKLRDDILKLFRSCDTILSKNKIRISLCKSISRYHKLYWVIDKLVEENILLELKNPIEKSFHYKINPNYNMEAE